MENSLLQKLDNLPERGESPTILFITGASGAGKTYLVENMETAVSHPKLGYFRFDTIGIPSADDMIKLCGSGEEWQKFATRQWVQRFAEDSSIPPAIVFEGQYNLDFAVEACQEFGITKYQLVVATVPDDVMVYRLTELRGQPELVTQDMRNWSAFLRKQGEAAGALILDTSAISTDEAIEKLSQELSVLL